MDKGGRYEKQGAGEVNVAARTENHPEGNRPRGPDGRPLAPPAAPRAAPAPAAKEPAKQPAKGRKE